MGRKTRKVFIFISVLLIIFSAILIYYRASASSRESKKFTDLAPIDGRLYSTNYGEVFIQESGSENGTPVLLVHGMGAWSELWRDTMNVISKKGFRVIAMDLPPFGFSERPSPETLDTRTQAMRILALIDKLGIDKIIIIGHSFGGGPVLHSALLSPSRIKFLVLVDIAANTEIVNPEKNSIHLVFDFLNFLNLKESLISATVTNPALTAFFFKKFVYNESVITEERVRVLQIPMQLKGGTEYMGKFIQKFVLEPDNSLAEDVSKLGLKFQFKTVLIWGDKDNVTPPERGKYFHQLIPGSELLMIENTGHIPQLESPEKFQKILLDSLESYR